MVNMVPYITMVNCPIQAEMFPYIPLPGFSVTAPWAFIWFLDRNENTVDISIVGTNGKCFLVNAHGVLRRMGALTEIPGNAGII